MVFGENQHLTKPGEVHGLLGVVKVKKSSSNDYMYSEMKIIWKQ